jgi:hypothetical protein
MTSHHTADRGGANASQMPSPHVPALWVDGPLSLEERLRVVRERCRLMADVFSIQAEATFLACHVSMSADAYNALTDMCRSSADDLERLAQDIPGAIANWCPDPRGGNPLGAYPEGLAGMEGCEWDRCKNPVDGDERP